MYILIIVHLFEFVQNKKNRSVKLFYYYLKRVKDYFLEIFL